MSAIDVLKFNVVFINGPVSNGLSALSVSEDAAELSAA